MIKKSFALILLLSTTTALFSQEIVSQDSIKAPVVKTSFLDSIKSTFVNHKISDKADNLWSKELSNLDIYNDLIKDIETIDPEIHVDYELPTDLLKQRLKALDEKSAFNIEYNPGLENIIKSFLKNRRHSYERLMGLSQYYFPIFEEAMAKYNIPLEIKYLAVVESALKPKAVSRAGATGLWQFMYHTGKQYKLNIDTYVDERSDVLKSSDAAARYMKGMYEIFNDWDLVLASYNSGAGNVTKAIRRSGGLTNYWNIKKKLPRETQGYVPAFIATMYIFEYHKEHGIKPEKPVVNHYATDTIAIKKQMTFKQLSDLLDISIAELEYLNPSYKRNVVPGITNTTNYLRLPVSKVAVFTSNEDKMYAYAFHDFDQREKPFVKPIVVKVKDTTMIANNEVLEEMVERKINKRVTKTKYYTVKRGDNLSEIADKNNVTMSDLKEWNHLKKNSVQKGRKLKIVYTDNIVIIQKSKASRSSLKENKPDIIVVDNPIVVSEKVTTPKKEILKETSKNLKSESNTDKEPTVEYIVKPGDNLFSIAIANKTTVAELKKLNNLTEENAVYAGDVLKITENKYTKKAKLPKTEMVYYKVKKGDNLSSIAEENNVTMNDLKEWNNLKDNNVLSGTRLKIQKDVLIADNKESKKNGKKEKTKLYIVKSGDSLYSISQQHNITIAEIKKLNNIKNENIVPGMKLKING